MDKIHKFQVASRYHIRVIHDWRRANQMVRIMPRDVANGCTDQNNNCTPNCFVATNRIQTSQTNSSPSNLPDENVATSDNSFNRQVSSSQTSLARNLSSELISESPIAASSPVHVEKSVYPDILEGSATASIPGTSNQAARHIWFSSDVQSTVGELSDGTEIAIKHRSCDNQCHSICKNAVCQAYVPYTRHGRVHGCARQSKSLPRTLLRTQESRDMSRRVKYVTVRSSLSESACQGYQPNERNDLLNLGVTRVVKETYV